MHFKFIMLVTTLILKYVHSTNFEGDYCYIVALNKEGVCKLISSCPSALKLAHTRRIVPQLCRFNRNRIPIVCCENHNVTTTPNTPSIEETTIPLIESIEITTPTISKESTTTPFQTPTSTVIPQIGDKSRQKCREYANYVFGTPTFDFVPRECDIVSKENSVAGTPARRKELPNVALIGYENYDDGQVHWLCGGSLISENYVLSVAHCQFFQNYSAPMYVLLGKTTMSTPIDGVTQMIPIERVIPYDGYIPTESYNDIALYKLQHNAVLNTYVRPACLNSNPTLDIGLSIASGWGHSGELEKVVLDMYTNEECNFMYRNRSYAHMRKGFSGDKQICAVSRNQSRYACTVASGDPLQIMKTNEFFCTHILVGINSFGRNCGMPDNSLVYTKVFHYIEWIEGIVWP